MIQSDSRKEEVQNILFLFFIVSVISVFFFLHIWRNIQFASLEHEIYNLKLEKKNLYEKVEHLRLSVAKYSTVSRRENLYRSRFGYVPVYKGKKIVTYKLPSVKEISASKDGNK